MRHRDMVIESPELLSCIMESLSVRSLLNAACVCHSWLHCCRLSWTVADHTMSPAPISRALPPALGATLLIAAGNPRIAEACLLRAIEFLEVPRRALHASKWQTRRDQLLAIDIVPHTVALMRAHSRDIRVVRRGCCALGLCIRASVLGLGVIPDTAVVALPTLIKSLLLHDDLRVQLLSRCGGPAVWQRAWVRQVDVGRGSSVGSA